MGKVVDITGEKYGRLKVICFAGKDSRNIALWKCKCDCGTEKILPGYTLRNGMIVSCGCYQRECVGKMRRRHGDYESPLYKKWSAMKQRCTNPNNKRYKDYGGRGITLSKEWYKYEPFRDWAMSAGYRDGLSIERIDNEKGYSPENCKWATMAEQSRNKRSVVKLTIEGETKILSEWAEQYGMEPHTLRTRLKRGWSLERALHQKVQKRKRAS